MCETPLTHTSLWPIQMQLYILRCIFYFSVIAFPYLHSCHFHFPAFTCVYKPHAPLALPPLRTITTVPISAASKGNSSPRADSLFLRGYYISANMWCWPYISVTSNISAVATSNLPSGYRVFLSFSTEGTFN
jgi:hypothetical protein